jgi:hypothetical protein
MDDVRPKRSHHAIPITDLRERAAVATNYDQGEMDEYVTFGKQYATSIKGGNALQPTATASSVRVRDGKVFTTDGPFAETKETIGRVLPGSSRRSEGCCGDGS